MKKKIKIFEVFKINNSLNVLITQELEYPISLSYKLLKIKRELDNIEEYVLLRMNKICPNIDFNNMDNNQALIYNTVFNSEIEIEIPEIDINEITKNNKVSISISDIKNIDLLLSKNT